MKQAIALVILILTSCHRSGTWHDNDDNWKRAFRTQRPDNVRVIQSRYWRSPHWTFEYEYHFHISANTDLFSRLVRLNDLELLSGADRTNAFRDFFHEKPGWFIPKSPEHYDTWHYKDRHAGRFRIFIDKDSQELFITDFQI
jgi:hypothetical protein